MTLLDYIIVLLVLAFMVGSVLKSRSRMQSVSDFLAAGRTAGRYLICVSAGIAMLGAVTVVAYFEMYYKSGFPMIWWGLTMAVVVLVVSASGWVVYRFRQTRAMTMAQFFEKRYSRNFRIFAGLVCYLSGIVNFGIFPAVGARFFIYFCGLPPSFPFLGIELSTFAFLMILLLFIALFFVFVGGQIAVILTDFIQGTFANIVFVVIVILFLFTFEPAQIFDALKGAPENHSLLNPYKTGQAEDFNFWFFLIGVVGFIYNMLAWQGHQAYNSSAKSAHEAKMAQVLSNWRNIPNILFMLFMGVCAYVVMHHLHFASETRAVEGVLDTMDSGTIRTQMTVPLVLTHFLPVGLMGALAAVMLAAFISTHDTYLHSWGSILVQDVLIPLRKKPLSPKQHIWWLRLSILFVAVFIFFFSLYFEQTDHIVLFMAITGAIYAGGAGSVIIGGLYWRRGSTAGAWAAMITGVVVSTSGILLNKIAAKEGASWVLFSMVKSDDLILEATAWIFSFNGQVYWLIAILSAIALYVFFSLVCPRRDYDMDRLLHRGKHAVKDEYKEVAPEPSKGLKILGVDKEFTGGDKIIYYVTYGWIFAWFIVFVLGTVCQLFTEFSDETWFTFWYVFLIANIVASVTIIIWFTIGGVLDIRYMFHKLKTMARDHSDDGSVGSPEE